MKGKKQVSLFLTAIMAFNILLLASPIPVFGVPGNTQGGKMKEIVRWNSGVNKENWFPGGNFPPRDDYIPWFEAIYETENWMDLTDFAVTWDANNIYFKISIRDIDYSENTAKVRPIYSVVISTVDGGGTDDIENAAMLLFKAGGGWEKSVSCAYDTSWSAWVKNGDWSNAGPGTVAGSDVNDVIERSVPWADISPTGLKPTDGTVYRMDVVTMWSSPSVSWRAMDPQAYSNYENPAGWWWFEGDEWNGNGLGPDPVDVMPGDETEFDWLNGTDGSDNYGVGWASDATHDPTRPESTMDQWFDVTISGTYAPITVDGDPSDWAGNTAYSAADPTGDTQSWAYTNLWGTGSGHIISIQTPDVSTLPGTLFNLSIEVTNVTKLWSWVLALKWNSTYLDCLDPGIINPANYPDFLDPGIGSGGTFNLQGIVDHAAGNFSKAHGYGYYAPGTAQNGSGVLAIATFNITSASYFDTFIDIEVFELYDDLANRMYLPTLSTEVKTEPLPPTPPVAAFTEDPVSPVLANDTITFDASGSTAGYNGSQWIPITQYNWTWGDGTPNTITANPVTTHQFPHNGTFQVCLTVTADDGIGWSDTDTTCEWKTVLLPPPGASIDIFTEPARWCNQTTPYVGKFAYQPADAYTIDEEVTVYAYLTWSSDPLQTRPVAFEVRDGQNNVVLIRTVFTNATGIAELSFRIRAVCQNIEDAFGKWNVTAKATVQEMLVMDTVYFDVGWLMTVSNIQLGYWDGNFWLPADPGHTYYKPNFWVSQVDQIKVEICIKNIGIIARNVSVSVDIIDESNVPVAHKWGEITVPGGEYCSPAIYCIEVFLDLPKWTYVGIANIYVNLYTDLPTECGKPYGPEASTWITVASQVPEGYPDP